MSGPVVELRQPAKFVGQATSMDLMLQSPGGEFSNVTATLSQNGKDHEVFALEQQAGAEVKKEAADQLYVIKPIGRKAIPDLRSGAARITGGRRGRCSTACAKSRRRSPATCRSGWSRRSSACSARSTTSTSAAASSSSIVPRPEDVVGRARRRQGIPRLPRHRRGIAGDPALRVAFFALLFDQPLDAPIQVFARDEAGNEAVAALDNRVFPSRIRRAASRSTTGSCGRVVPAIAGNTPGRRSPPATTARVPARSTATCGAKNNAYIASLAQKTSPDLQFRDAFQQLGDSQVEARFADTRTYIYKGKDVDQQVHLGFDLAVTANVPIRAAQKGVVLHAAYLGIYGNCVIVDHGMGVQSLYGHLSSINVKVGDRVEKGQVLGRSGMTGLAGGDHLHFTMLVGGQQVTPVDWWSQQWMEDRVLRKIKAAGGPAS